MKLYIVRRNSNKIIGCFLSLERAKACVDREINDQDNRRIAWAGHGFDKISLLTTGNKGKLYCKVGAKSGISSVNPDSVISVCWVWIQEHYLNFSPLELLAKEAE